MIRTSPRYILFFLWSDRIATVDVRAINEAFLQKDDKT